MNEVITVPEKIRLLPLKGLPLDPVLLHHLDAAGCGVLGQLHGMALMEVLSHVVSTKARGDIETMLRTFLDLAGGSVRPADAPGAGFHPSGADDPEAAGTDTIRIPEWAMDRSLGSVRMEVRTRNVLARLQRKTFRDLNGMSFDQLRNAGNFGKRSEADLRQALALLNKGTLAAPQAALSKAAEIEIPDWAADWPLDQLPMAARTRNALRNSGMLGVGELNGRGYASLLAMENFGKRSVEDLRKLVADIHAGQFGRSSIKDGFPEVSRFNNAMEFLREFVNAQVKGLEPKDRDMLEMRLGLRDGVCASLDAIGSKYSLSRERIRQIVDETMKPEMRLNGGPRLLQALDVVRKDLEERWEPLAEEHVCSALVSYLDPAVPVWTELPASCEVDETPADLGELKKAIRELLDRYGNSPVHLWEVCRYAVEHVGGMSVAQFYSRTRRLSEFVVENEAGALFLKRRSLKLAQIASAVLEESATALTGEQILELAVKKGLVENGLYSNANSLMMLVENDEFLLLGPQTIGLRKHIGLSEKLWEVARRAFDAYLRKLGRPCAVGLFHRECRDAWASQTNTHELAAIMDLDKEKRFVRVAKRMVFGRTADSSGRVPEIEDLVLDFLENEKEATLQQINEAVNKVRVTAGVKKAVFAMVDEGLLTVHGEIYRLA